MRARIKLGLIATIFILCFLPEFAGAQWMDEKPPRRLRGPELYATKSATSAFLIGLGPGLLVHGWGHFYVGDKKTGGWLLASECVSVVSSYYLAMAGVAAMDSRDTRRKLKTAFIFTAAIFVTGWVYDFLDAPNKVIDSRKFLKMKPSLSIVPERHSVKLGLAMAF